MRRLARFDYLTVAAFVLMGFYLRIREWADLDRAIPKAHPGDPQLFEVMLAHAARWVTHGGNPLFSERWNVPDGVNMMANTSIFALSVPLAPLTLLFGPHITVLLIFTLALPATATAWYFVLSRTIVTSRLAAAAGAVLAGFGPSIVSHGSVHVNFATQFMVPIIIYLSLRVMQSETRKQSLKRGTALGLCVVYQFFLGAEMLLFTAITVFVFYIVYAAVDVTYVKNLWEQQRRWIVRGVTLAIGVAVLLLAYPIYFQFFGPQHYRGLPGDVNIWGADIVSYFAFALETSTGALTYPAAFSSDIFSNVTEQNSYLSWPLLIVLIVGAVWLWDNLWVRSVAITGVVFVVFSLGHNLYLAGNNTGIAMPWAILGQLPILDHAIPSRFGLIVLMCAGILIAFIVERALETERPRNIKWLTAVGVALLLIFPTPYPTVQRPEVPEFIASEQWRDYIEDDRSMLVAPLNTYNNFSFEGFAMHWQAISLMEFRLVNAYFIGPDDEGNARFGPVERPTTELLYSVQRTRKVPVLTEEDKRQARADLEYWETGVVVLGDHRAGTALRLTLTELIGEEPLRRGGVWVWKID